jgi:magnesium transporter
VTKHPEATETEIRVIAYRPDEYAETELTEETDLKKLMSDYEVCWVNVNGLADTDRIKEVAETFEVHSLALEDIVNVHQRPKVEIYDEHLFVVARLASYERRLGTRQMSVYLGDKFVLTFHERPEEVFDLVRDRIRNGRGRIRKAGPDYLAYALLDVVVDHYFPVLEQLGEELAELELAVVDYPVPDTLSRIHKAKRDLLGLRRTVWPLREAVSKLLLPDTPVIRKETRLYVRDVWDHVFQLMDLVENFREIGTGLMDVYLSSVSNRTNEIMKILTMIATIFIPLSFVAGVYGMNFDTSASPLNMPELKSYWGYPAVLLVMVGAAAAFLLFFRKKGWLGNPEGPRPPGRDERSEAEAEGE